MELRSPKGISERLKLRRLYSRAFPRSEKKPFSLIRAMQRKGITDVIYFSDRNGFLGLAITVNSPDIILIDYFAVAEKRRGEGHGTEMLKALISHYAPRAIFLEIEKPDASAKNNEERLRRKAFYERCGLVPLGTDAKLFGVDMELLGIGCSLSFEEYRRFYLENYGSFGKIVFKNILPI